MVELTDTATEVISELTAQPDLPEHAGLRISTGAEDADGHAWAAELTDGPGPQDQILELSSSGRLYLEPHAADRLADKVLDAETIADGEPVFHVRHRTHEDQEDGEQQNGEQHSVGPESEAGEKRGRRRLSRDRARASAGVQPDPSDGRPSGR